MTSTTKQLLAAVAVIGASVAAAKVVMSRAPATQGRRPDPKPYLVETFAPETGDRAATVVAQGIVRPAQQVTVTPQLSGSLVYVSNQLTPGGRFAKGAVLARIDPRDYELALRQEQSRVRKAQLDLRLEKGRQETAAREWRLLGDARPSEQAPLALRKPQLEVATLALEAAESSRKRAELALERTNLTAPFNAMVVEEQVDLGQVVGPSTRVATLVGTDRAWVTVSLPIEKLSLVDTPGTNATRGSKARVVQSLGDGSQIERTGRVLRLGGQLDPETRRAELIVEIDAPLGRDGEIPLLPQAFVKVEIEGRTIPGVVAVPRTAVHDDLYVWTVDDQERLMRRDVSIRWTTEDTLFVLFEGDLPLHIVTSPLSVPIEGMTVTRVGASTQAAAID